MSQDLNELATLCVYGTITLAPSSAAADPLAFATLGVRPFETVEISTAHAAAACRLTPDATIPQGALEVHDVVMWHLRALPGDLLTLRRTSTQVPTVVRLKSWLRTSSPAAVGGIASSVLEATLRRVSRMVCLPAACEGATVAALVQGSHVLVEKIKRDRVIKVPKKPRQLRQNIVSELVDFGTMFSSLGRLPQRAGFVPGLLVSGTADTVKTHSIADVILQLHSAGIYTAYCDAELALDEALCIQESRLETLSWSRVCASISSESRCHYLHNIAQVASSKSRIVVLDNFGAVIQAAQQIMGYKLPKQNLPHDSIKRAGAALRLMSAVSRLFQLENRLCRPAPAGVLVISDKSPKRCNFGLRSQTKWYYEVTIRMSALDKTNRAAVCATRLKEAKLHPSINIWELAWKFALTTAGLTSTDIINAADETILRSAARAHENRQAAPLGCCNVAIPCRRPTNVASMTYTFDATALWQEMVPSSTSRWRRVGGCEKAKYELEKAFVWPRTRNAQFLHFRLNACRGVLLYGPPGNGKTLLARSLADETEATFIGIQSGEVLKPYLGESEAAIHELFEHAREVVPCIMYFEEFDAIGSARAGALQASGSTLHTRIIATLLDELDGIYARSGSVVILAATNRIDSLDAALLRPGRIEMHVYVGSPNMKERVEILEVASHNLSLDHVLIYDLAAKTHGATAAQLVALCREAGLLALSLGASAVGRTHFSQAIAAENAVAAHNPRGRQGV